MSIHDNLKQLRLNSRLTQEQVAEKIGITRQAISSYESGRTLPDIDMLLRFCQIYATDLDGIVYGRQRQLQKARRLKQGTRALLAILLVLTLFSSAMLWSAHHFFALSSGQLSAENLAVFNARQKLTRGWELTDSVILNLSSLGFLSLLLLQLYDKCTVSPAEKLRETVLFTALLLLIPTLFAAIDPVFGLIDYLITPLMLLLRLLLYLALSLIIARFSR